MKTKLLFVTVWLIAVITYIDAQSKTYFVSPDGNDHASGLSVKEAWKTLDRVNETTFLPGDQILFQAGAIWEGQLQPQGSGVEGAPIRISYYGGKKRPVINIGRAEGAGIRLTNQSWWEIENIEITSGAAPELGIGRQGIVAVAKGENQEVEHIVVRNCYIHDIWGQMGGDSEYSGYFSAGILIRVQYERGRDRYAPPTSKINDVLVENNIIERMDKCGIIVWGPDKNVRVRKNYIDNMGGDGIFVSGCYRGVIEYNEVRRTCMRSGHPDLPGGEKWWPHTAAVWIARAEETVMQFNEVYDTGRNIGNGDGMAYDFDFDCKRCTLQYNYSKNNHGFLLIMNRTFENVTRYNISENDQTHLVQLHCDITDRNIIHNNVFYVDYGTVDLDIFRGNDGMGDINKLGATFHNNIFYATGQGRFRSVYTAGDVLVRTFDEETKPGLPPGSIFLHNTYFGPWKNGLPDDPEKLVADPLFVAPGTGGNGLCTLEGYKLQPNSPCINTGMFIPLNSTRDFFGNPVNDGSVDYGAYEQIGSGVFADKQKEDELNRVYRIKSRLAWAKWLFPSFITIPEGNEKPVITLREQLEPTITVNLKAQKNNVFTLPVKNDKDVLLNTPLRVVLREGEFTEEWDIPFSTEQNMGRR